MSAVVVPFARPRRSTVRRSEPERTSLADLRAQLRDAYDARRTLRDHLERFQPGDFEYATLHRVLSALGPEIQNLESLIRLRERLRVIR
jgi:hypothetical protein